MEKLPPEMVAKILKMLDEDDLEICLWVTQLWKDVINDMIGVRRLVGNEPDFCDNQNYFTLECEDDFMSAEEIDESDTGISCFVFGDVGDEEVPKFRNQYLIKQLELYGTITRTNFDKLVQSFYNLRDLTFDLTAFNAVEFVRGKTWLNFPQLKYLNISGDVMTPHYLRSVPNHEVLYSNFLTLFLDTEFPKLNTLLLLLVPLALTSQQSTLMDALVVFLDKHKLTLRTFELLSANRLNFTGKSPRIEKIQSLDSLRLTTLGYFPTELNPHHIDILFKSLIQSQTTLCYFLDTTSVYSSKLIQQNASTLVMLDLFVISEGSTTVIDCEVFSECKALKSLSIVGPSGEDKRSKGTITKTKFLLESVEHIRFIEFNMSTADAADLVTKDWKMLKFLDLQAIGTEADFGVPFDALCIVLATKKIKNVFIVNGMNTYTLDLASDLPNKYKSELIIQILELFEIDQSFGLDIGLEGDDNDYAFQEGFQYEFYHPDSPRPIKIQLLHKYPQWGSLGFGSGYPVVILEEED